MNETKIDLDAIVRTAREWSDEDADWYPNVGPKTTLALTARIRELDEALSDAIAHMPAGDERDRLVAVLAKGAVLP